MNALELADAVEPLVLTSFHETHYIGRKAADMLRRQHEAIQQSREALKATCDYIDSFAGDSTSYRAIIAKVEQLK